MSRDPHFQALERMYLAAPINRIYRPTIEVRSGEAEIEIVLAEKYFHSGGAVHGSVYFKMLDDAAFFAAGSLERCSGASLVVPDHATSDRWTSPNGAMDPSPTGRR